MVEQYDAALPIRATDMVQPGNESGCGKENSRHAECSISTDGLEGRGGSGHSFWRATAWINECISKALRTKALMAKARRGNAARYIPARLQSHLIALAAIFSLNFMLPRLMPGDPLHAIYGDVALVAMSDEMQAHLIQQLSLDKSWWDQMQAYLLGLMHGDLGFSYYYRDQVSQVILGAMPWTVLLAGFALIIATLIGIILGIESGYNRGSSLDRGLVASLMFLSGFPDFFIGVLLLLIFAVSLDVLPLSGATSAYAGYQGLSYVVDVLRHLALPLAAMVLVQLGDVFLLTRNTVVTLLGESFILTARAKGCPERLIKYAHAGRNALLPVTTATGMRIPHLITRVLFIEIVFSYPGIGSLLNTAISARDYPLIQGILLVVTLIVLSVNFLVDLLYMRLDPRVRYAY